MALFSDWIYKIHLLKVLEFGLFHYVLLETLLNGQDSQWVNWMNLGTIFQSEWVKVFISQYIQKVHVPIVFVSFSKIPTMSKNDFKDIYSLSMGMLNCYGLSTSEPIAIQWTHFQDHIGYLGVRKIWKYLSYNLLLVHICVFSHVNCDSDTKKR